MQTKRFFRRAVWGMAQKVEQAAGWAASRGCEPKVYMLHSVDRSEGDLNPCSITESSFRGWLERSIQKKTPFASLDQFDYRKPVIYLSFDDIYQTVFDVAFPILAEWGIPFTCFVSPGLVGKAPYISRDSLAMLASSSLCTIGAHTTSHSLLSYCDLAMSNKEIVGSKEILEQVTGSSVELFAYPYGSYYACKNRDKTLVKEAGFRLAFSTVSRPVFPLDSRNPFFIPRINVEESNWRSL